MKFYIRDDYKDLKKFILLEMSELSDLHKGYFAKVIGDVVYLPDCLKLEENNPYYHLIAAKKHEVFSRIEPVSHSQKDFKVVYVPLEGLELM